MLNHRSPIYNMFQNWMNKMMDTFLSAHLARVMAARHPELRLAAARFPALGLATDDKVNPTRWVNERVQEWQRRLVNTHVVVRLRNDDDCAFGIICRDLLAVFRDGVKEYASRGGQGPNPSLIIGTERAISSIVGTACEISNLASVEDCLPDALFADSPWTNTPNYFDKPPNLALDYRLVDGRAAERAFLAIFF